MLNKKDTQDLYNILNKKQPKVSTGRSIPSKSLGEDGSLHISILPSGPKLFAKFKNEWLHVSLNHIKNLTKKNRSENINNLYTSLVRFLDGDKSHHTGIKAHATTTENVDYVLPASKPGSTALLKSDSSGNLEWDTGGVTPTAAILNNRILGNVSGGSSISSALTGSQVTAILDDATTSAKGISSFNTDDFVLSSGAVSAKRKMVFSSDFAGRYSVGTSDQYIAGFPGYYVKSTNTGIHTGQDTSETTLADDSVKYSIMMPESGTVVGFVCDCEWDTANGEIDVDLWKVDAISDTGSGLTSVGLDHIARITFTDPSDTTYYKALADNGGLDGTAKAFTAGESLLVTGMSEDSSDGNYVYLRPVVTVIYDS